MKRVAALLVIGAISASGCAMVVQKPKLHRRASWHWDNVASLRPGTPIRVGTVDLETHEGTLIAADDAGLSVQTAHGAVSTLVAFVQRVERIEPPRKRNRVGRVLRAAAGGTGAFVMGVAGGCMMLGGRPCAPSAKQIAVTAAAFGAMGAMPESGLAMLIYERP